MSKIMLTTFRLITIACYFREVHLNECGGSLTSDTGWINSPDDDSNGKYDDNVDCWWNITAQIDNVVEFKFLFLEIDDSFRCMNDIVEVYDGDARIFWYCDGHPKTPRQNTTVSNIMRVHFRSDDVDSKAGFTMTYSVVKVHVEECGGFLTADTGWISSPDNDFDGKHDHNVDCWWNITAGMGDVIEFKFSLLEIDGSFRCMEDILEIYDDDVRIFLYCDGQAKSPSQNRTVSNTMRVYFRSDDTNNKAGFNMTYLFIKVDLKECGGYVTSETGWISSPDHDFDGKYDHNVVCWWNITAGMDDVIEFKFFSLEIDDSFRCIEDIIEIYDNDVRIFLYCDGHEKNPSQNRTDTNIMRVYFRSDDSNSKAGFNMTYSFVKVLLNECGGSLTSDTGWINSPDDDSNGKYDDNVDCWWNITAQIDNVVEFKFLFLEIDDSFRCMDDIVEVYDGDARIFWYCDGHPKTPRQNTTVSNIMRVHFRSDDVDSKAGFTMTYSVVKVHVEECGGFLTADTGWISSPDNDFDGKYDHNVDCWWNITAGMGDVIEFKFSLLEIDGSFRCMEDILEIYDDDVRIFLYCDGQAKSPSQNRTVSNTMRVYFRSDDTNNKAGFNMTYLFIKVDLKECGGYVTSETGWISSPDHDFDGKYDHNVVCWWNITAGMDDVIEFKFFSLEIDDSFRCIEDIIEIYDNDVRIFLYCDGHEKNPSQNRTDSNIMRVYFRSDDSNSKAGFNMTYSFVKAQMKDCGGFLTSDTGWISSPDNDFNGKYDDNVDCWWNITAGMNNVVEFEFSLLKIDGNFRCTEDVIEIYDDDERIFRYCDGFEKRPSQSRTDSNTMRVHFRSDDSKSKAGFNMTYSVIKAMATLTSTGVSNPSTDGASSSSAFSSAALMAAVHLWARLLKTNDIVS